MNRRGFLRSLVAAPIAAAVVPMAVARPAFATGGMIKGTSAVLGEYAGEAIFPVGVSWSSNSAWLMKGHLGDILGTEALDHAAFEEAAACLDGPVEVHHEQV